MKQIEDFLLYQKQQVKSLQGYYSSSEFLKKVWKYTKDISDYYRSKTDCFDLDGCIKKVEYIIAIDNDPISAVWAGYLYYLHIQTHNEVPTILSVGGVGLLSAYMLSTPRGRQFKNEAERLDSIVCELGIPEKKVIGKTVPVSRVRITRIVRGNGKNTSGNLQDIENIIGDSRAIICVTPRLSYRFKSSQIKQKPLMKLSYFVIEQTPEEEACSLCSGNGLVNAKPYINEITSIPNRYLRYGGKHQIDEDRELPYDIKIAYQFLNKYYYIKNIRPWHIHKIYYAKKQFAELKTSLIANQNNMNAELNAMIHWMKQKILSERLASREELGLF